MINKNKTSKEIRMQLERIRTLTVDLCISNFGNCSQQNFNHSIYGEMLKKAIKIVSNN
jgi:hypothetical protein|nr:MAG TPA: hypothetical protein [Caudoviricetes sp.]